MEPTNEPSLLGKAKDFAERHFKEKIGDEYVFHDFEHAVFVVNAAERIAAEFDLSPKDLEILQLAGWFHDLGYNQGPEGHEKRSITMAEAFLRNHQYPEEDIALVSACIWATKMGEEPVSLLQQIMVDADFSHLGSKSYWDRSGKIRQELTSTKNILQSEQEWLDFELDFMLQHEYHTEVAKKLFEKTKQKHIRQLYKKKVRLNPELEEVIEIPPKPGKKKKNKNRIKAKLADKEVELKELRLGRGVETMYRTTYRTHVNLSSIADNKANIMLSINAIVISIVVTTLVPSFQDNTRLIIPTIILLAVCLAAMVYATLSTRPKVTEGKFTRQDIENKSANLLFFGNYYNMDLDDFHWGMMEMIKDSDFLYSSMTRDLYFLGKVLAKKYRYLSICYAIFMYGLIISVAAFAAAFLLF